jgi:hypothetical protein
MVDAAAIGRAGTIRLRRSVEAWSFDSTKNDAF